MFENGIIAQMIYNSPDIAEKTEFGYYLGYFEAGTDETMENNCLIIEMRQDGDATTRKFADGLNSLKTHTWAKRREYNYEFAKKRL